MKYGVRVPFRGERVMEIQITGVRGRISDSPTVAGGGHQKLKHTSHHQFIIVALRHVPVS